MNEQTKELAMKYANKMGNSVLHNAEHLEKFAEVIVRECAEIANAGIDPAESHLIGDDILEHFGVDTKIDINKKIEDSLRKADKDIQEGLRKQYLESLARLNGDLS
jgi:hypothetical protein